jgi:hypothetical protein
MKRCVAGSWLSTLLAVFCVANSFAQTATQPQPSQKSANAGHHGVFTVELLKPLDSKKLKEGDQVEAKLVGGITLPNGSQVPAGTKVAGHITQVKAASKSAPESSLGISFDKLVRPGGEDTPIKGVLQAVGPKPNADLNTGGYIDSGPSLRMLTQSQPPNMQKPATKTVTDDSTGVVGFKNMQMGSDGVLTSNGKDLKLDAGTRMLLNVTIQ